MRALPPRGRLAGRLLTVALVAAAPVPALVGSAGGADAPWGLEAPEMRRQVQAQEAIGTGRHLYDRDCASCHGPSGEGSPRGVSLESAGAASAHFYISTGRMPLSHPDERMARSEPIYGDEEIDALVAYVESLGDGPPIPDVDVSGADLADGGVAYRLHCAQCHGSTGVGTALAYGVVAPSLLASTPVHVAESLLVGPGAMPQLAPHVLDEEEVAAVARYVQYLQDPVDAGGAPLARSGRLDETAVAWLGGVAVLVLAAWRIARRA